MMLSVVKILIKFYRYALSPLFPPACRFEPSCSLYALICLENRGARGFLPAFKRIVKCHPFHPGGYDPPV